MQRNGKYDYTQEKRQAIETVFQGAQILDLDKNFKYISINIFKGRHDYNDSESNREYQYIEIIKMSQVEMETSEAKLVSKL